MKTVDYEAIAEVIRQARKLAIGNPGRFDGVIDVQSRLSSLFHKDNPNFSESKFGRECYAAPDKLEEDGKLSDEEFDKDAAPR